MEIGFTFERLARGLRLREIKMADPPPRTTHSRISAATQATPWQGITLTLYGDFHLARKDDLRPREINLMEGPLNFLWGTKAFDNCSLLITLHKLKRTSH